MKMTRVMPVDQLEVGMFVARLDRPWLETPFLFQGFYIRDNREIEEIGNHCKHVHVTCESLLEREVGNADPAQDAVVSLPASPAKGKRFRLRDLFHFGRTDEPADDFLDTNIFYRETKSLKEEVHTATDVHRQALTTVKGVMENLRTSNQLDLDRLEQSVRPMVDSVLRNPAALACLMRMRNKDDYLYHHSIASSVWATILGRQIGLTRDDIDLIAMGAMLLDVGKTQIPEEVLAKPGKLNDTEQGLMRRHVQFGLDILEKTGGIDHRVLDMVAHHHERYNGTGYPQRLRGNDIPVFGRIAGIVDAYDAMITPRPYAQLQSSYDAIRKLRNLADVEFQAEIVDQFTKAIGVFPTGTLVELNTGEVAIVTKQNRIRRLRPEVMVIMDSDKQLLDDFRVIDLNEETVAPIGKHSLWIELGLPPGAYEIDPTEFYLV